MVTDSHLMNIQLAILGVILIIGMFYLWRSLARIESKIDMLTRQVMIPYDLMPPPRSGAGPMGDPSTIQAPDVREVSMTPEESEEDGMEENFDLADELLKNVFGGAGGAAPMFTLFTAGNNQPMAAAPKAKVVIEEEEPVAAAPMDATAAAPVPVAAPAAPMAAAPKKEMDTESLVSVSTGLTKSKVKRMNLEELRALCRERNLPTEGTRVHLLERVLGSMA